MKRLVLFESMVVYLRLGKNSAKGYVRTSNKHFDLLRDAEVVRFISENELFLNDRTWIEDYVKFSRLIKLLRKKLLGWRRIDPMGILIVHVDAPPRQLPLTVTEREALLQAVYSQHFFQAFISEDQKDLKPEEIVELCRWIGRRDYQIEPKAEKNGDLA
jgi:hypothetical protein